MNYYFNHLKEQSSPYLLQHAQNPVDWYPWGEEAFEKAKQEDKPIFLSIGYSTCHWCHVMAHECFENKEIADILNQYFISVKVDREERPDIDSVYMSVCQALTGSGGWPMSIFLTAEQKPFFTGTYYPPISRPGMIGFPDLLLALADKWNTDRSELLTSAENIYTFINAQNNKSSQDSKQNKSLFSNSTQNIPPKKHKKNKYLSTNSQAQTHLQNNQLLQLYCDKLTKSAAESFSQNFDQKYGGFGEAPKFPMPHNLIFLILYSQLNQDSPAEKQAVITLEKMRRGGIFDQIGSGFSRYSTDPYYLAPHFEKMLYDNALLILSYSLAYKVTGNPVFLDTAEKTADYIFREMTGKEGEFYSAQDADSEGKEGKYYLWDYQEICDILGEKTGNTFCDYFGITKKGNFEGKNIPNLLNGNPISNQFEREKTILYQHRKSRFALHLDDKILTSWNSLMITALSYLYQITGKKEYLKAAENACRYIEKYLKKGSLLYVSCRKSLSDNKNALKTNPILINGFLEDYAYYTTALISLYQATSLPEYLIQAEQICQETHRQFEDQNAGGYFLYGLENNPLITKPKETYDGALPSGNSVIAYCLVRLFQITGKESYQTAAERQLTFLSLEAKHYPAGYPMFLTALLFYCYPPEKITVVLSEKDTKEAIFPNLPLYADIKILSSPTEEYKLLHQQTTYYRCKNYTCLPPTNQIVREQNPIQKTSL